MVHSTEHQQRAQHKAATGAVADCTQAFACNRDAMPQLLFVYVCAQHCTNNNVSCLQQEDVCKQSSPCLVDLELASWQLDAAPSQRSRDLGADLGADVDLYLGTCPEPKIQQYNQSSCISDDAAKQLPDQVHAVTVATQLPGRVHAVTAVRQHHETAGDGIGSATSQPEDLGGAREDEHLLLPQPEAGLQQHTVRSVAVIASLHGSALLDACMVPRELLETRWAEERRALACGPCAAVEDPGELYSSTAGSLVHSVLVLAPWATLCLSWHHASKTGCTKRSRPVLQLATHACA
jgi:hypothetical protein